ncbi:tripartite motif-containing protein 16-like protein [Brachyhypopomus gauderio]|uniref:tripartite motif-containing protein 16-like protein n=1 Tax=Brachyhypopomus gauderio TaxID=698409 RepID=UPI0040432A06
MTEVGLIRELPGHGVCPVCLASREVDPCLCILELNSSGEPRGNGSGGEPLPVEMMSTRAEQKGGNVQEEPRKSLVEPEGSQEGPAGEDDVACDSCIDSPRRATKSCLTCQVSYCDLHLRPHLEKAKFQDHRLVEPLREVEGSACGRHGRLLELFCITDVCCVCQECVAGQHMGHETLPITLARHKTEKELQDKHTEILKTIAEAENSISKVQSNVLSVEVCVQEVRKVLQEQFSVLQGALEQVQAELSQSVEVDQQQTLHQARGVRLHLELRCAELKRTQAHLARLAKVKNDLHYLQEYSQWKKSSCQVPLPAVPISVTGRLHSLSRIISCKTQELCDSLLLLYRNTLTEAYGNVNAAVEDSGQAISDVQRYISLPEPKSREDFLKYAVTLTFDVTTAHQFLRLMNDGRKVTNTTPWQHDYPDGPERFLHWKQVLVAESVYLGRHYFEVDLSGEGVHVGVAYTGISRRSPEAEGCLTGSGASWCLQWNGRSFSAWHAGEETLVTAPKAMRLGVYVDYASSVLAFYAVGGDMNLLHQYRAELVEPLYPACWLPKKDNVVVLVEPGEELPLNSPSPF